ncbi:hypothetical protein ACFL5V_10230 [Fibrobacterota bacterium]
MKKISLLLSSLCLLVAVSMVMGADAKKGGEKAQAPAKKEAVKKAGGSKTVDTLKVTGRLLEIPGTMPPNDIYNYVYVMKYRVLKVLQGKYAEKEILVGQYNPLMPRGEIKDKMGNIVGGNVEAFKAGDKHNLVLVAPLADYWSEATEDEYFDEEEKVRYFGLQTNKSK